MKRIDIDAIYLSEFAEDIAELTADYEKRSYYIDGKTVPTDLPENPRSGDTWFDDKTAKMFVHIDGAWTEL